MNLVQVIEIVTPDCGVCKMIAPAVNQAMKEFTDANGGDFEFKKLTVGHDEEAGELAKEYGIKAVPAFIVYEGEKFVSLHSGTNLHGLLQDVRSLLELYNVKEDGDVRDNA